MQKRTNDKSMAGRPAAASKEKNILIKKTPARKKASTKGPMDG